MDYICHFVFFFSALIAIVTADDMCEGDVYCHKGHCCGNGRCCTYYYELWWFWVLWLFIAMVSGCCCYQKRQAARRRELEHAQQQHVFRDATGCAVPAPNGKLFVLPSYEEVLSTHNTGAPPLYSALYDNVVQGPRDVGSLAIPSTSLSSDVDNATVQSVTEHQIEVSVDIRDDDDEHLPAYSSRVGSEDSLITA